MDLMNLPITKDLLWFVAGGFFLLVSVVQFFRLLLLTRNGIKTTATIKDLIESRQTHSVPVYFPVFEYRAENGELITAKSYIGLDKRHQLKIGEKVNILYNPKKPGHFLLDTGMDKYWKIIGALIAGVVFIAAGALKLI